MTQPADSSHVPDWVRDAIFYQIFPERFANGDTSLDPPGTVPWGTPPTRTNMMGGDLRGITDRLPHVRDLGATALYLTPIFAARTNHRYDTSDYLRIDPRLGDEASFKEMVDTAHDLGIRVVLDAVFHHCGDGHWAFQDVTQHGERSAYVNWFYVQEFPIRAEPEPSYLTCSGCHYLPKLNVHNPEVRDHLFEAVRKWSSFGIDGWRLDVPYMMDNLPFWRQFRQVVKSINPDLYIVAEVWEEATDWTRGDTSDAAMNYRLRDALLDFLVDRRTGATELVQTLASIDREVGPAARGGMLNLLASHDTDRIRTRCGDDTALTRLALGMLFAAEGAPMVYYGDEVGMRGFNDPDCRGAMPWDSDAWDHDILDWVRTLSALRRDNVALRRGDQHALLADDDVLVLARRHPQQTVAVAVNRGNATRSVAVAEPGTVARDLVADTTVDTSDVPVGPRSIRFLELSPAGPATA